ncbi:MAG: ATP-dependent Clp protease ATP-binding subunit [Oscillospiraceae bacterium]|nr:ATP-dependent Clp protease ATP-binding subunit [Oscillospiraceae bacterium]MBQ6849504.1 ATP-dependent Clp protease ATP-binding subunit [Oscillospiraceae bacterium]
MLCERCKKRPAMIYIQSNEGGQTKSKGYCLTCAKELGIKPVDDMMKQMGIDDEALKAMEEQMDSFMQDNMDENGDFNFGKMFGGMGMGMPGGDFDEEDFEQGGSPTIPFGNDDSKDGKKDKKKKNKRKFLEQYCENLTRKASDGKIDNIIGRDDEIYRTIQILCRRQKNNPCLIGEAGVGKTAIAEGIALKIGRGEVPQKLKNKEIYLVNMTNLVAGTQFRGQFEARVKSLIGEVKESGNIILFIDEIHTITGAGDSEGAMNAGNILKPALSRGEIQVIGATTFSEYRKFIEKDAALERRFQPVKVEEPSISDTIDIITGVKQYYEAYHHVQVPQNIVDLTVRMSEKYITDRFLPDKAIDLLDEACACCSLRHTEISDWLSRKEELDTLNATLDSLQAETSPDYEKIAHVRAKLFGVEEEEKALREKVEGIAVELDDIAKVIQLWTGISAVKVKESEFNKVANLEAKLKEHIKGQDEAVSLVAKAIKRNRAGISGRNRPASFLFVGPTGVGKTELVKQLASQLFDTVDPLIRFDMSEFMEKHAVSRLVGSPPGYVGYDEAGQLTEKVRRKPYSVVLFDEIEKAHPDVMNILLQILDEGRINDAQGRTVNFENTVIAMTSNAGSGDKVGHTGFGQTVADMSREKTMRALNSFLRPEFLARVDEIVVFDPLSEETLADIAQLMLSEYVKPMQQKGIEFTWDKELLSLIVKKAQGGKFGARDIRRVIRKEVEDRIAEIIVEQTGVSSVHVWADGENIAVNWQ